MNSGVPDRYFALPRVQLCRSQNCLFTDNLLLSNGSLDVTQWYSNSSYHGKDPVLMP